MSQPNIPGFTAEISLSKTNEKYFVEYSPSAVRSEAGLVYPARFLCTRGMCVCSGDDDCNGMFSTSCKDGGYARCWVRGPRDSSVFCVCAR
jgi:hypothetical protein